MTTIILYDWMQSLQMIKQDLKAIHLQEFMATLPSEEAADLNLLAKAIKLDRAYYVEYILTASRKHGGMNEAVAGKTLEKLKMFGSLRQEEWTKIKEVIRQDKLNLAIKQIRLKYRLKLEVLEDDYSLTIGPSKRATKADWAELKNLLAGCPKEEDLVNLGRNLRSQFSFRPGQLHKQSPRIYFLLMSVSYIVAKNNFNNWLNPIVLFLLKKGK